MAAAVAEGELVAGWGWVEVGDEAEAVGHGGDGEQGVLALAQVGVVEVDCEREHVDGEGVGEGGFKEAGALLFGGGLERGAAGLGRVEGAGGGAAGGELDGALAGLVGVLGGFPTDVGEGLLPEQGSEAVGECVWERIRK